MHALAPALRLLRPRRPSTGAVNSATSESMKLYLAVVVAFGLVACGKKEPTTAPEVVPATPTADAVAAADVSPSAAVAAADVSPTAAVAAADVSPSAAAAAADVSPTAAVAAAADCVPHDVMAVLGSIDPDFAKLDNGAVSLCGFAQETRYCVALDLASGKRTSVKLADNDVAHLPSFPAGFDEGLVKDEGRPVLKLCPAAETRCQDLHVGQALAAHFDANKSRVVVTALEEGKLTAHIYDAATRTSVMIVPIADSDLPNCTFATFVGESLLISTGACTGGGKAWLADVKTGAKISDLGKVDGAFVKDGQLAQVEGNVWAFRDAAGKVAYLQDVVTGEVQATVDLEKASDGTKMKDDQAFVFATASDVYFVEARPLIGTVFVASRKDGAVTKTHLPRPCP